jgi:transposase-like protein
MNRMTKFPPEARERAVRMVVEQSGKRASQWAAIESIAAPKAGCTSQTLQQESRHREDVTAAEHQRIKALECEVKKLRRASEILKLASAKELEGLRKHITKLTAIAAQEIHAVVVGARVLREQIGAQEEKEGSAVH